MQQNNPPQLTDDIIRKIICYSKDSVGQLRRVSHHWKNLVEEEFSNLSNLPTIDEMEIAAAEDDPSIVVELRIKAGFGFVLRNLSKFGFWEVKSAEKSLVSVQKDLKLYELINSRPLLLETPKNIKRVVLRDLGSHLKFVSDYFTNVLFEELCFDEPELTPTYSQEMLNIIREWNAEKVHLSIRFHSLDKPTDFLVELADGVDALRITQMHSDPYLFGDDFEKHWLTALSEMLTKRVSKIKIEHDNKAIVGTWNMKTFVDQISVNTAGKQPWLEINAFYYRHVKGFSVKHTSEDIILTVSRNKRNVRECLITIKHQSRMGEKF